MGGRGLDNRLRIEASQNDERILMSISRGCKWDISYSFALGIVRTLGQIIEL
jgi:hypothetical protein